MTYAAKHPAAFINVIVEDGTKDEAIEWLQRTWDELQNLRIALVKLGFTIDQIDAMMKDGTLGKVF